MTRELFGNRIFAYFRAMKLIPVILILVSFLIICLGAYLRSQHNMLGLPLIMGGLIAELIFIVMNRMINKKQ